jgi:hypothetical protein
VIPRALRSSAAAAFLLGAAAAGAAAAEDSCLLCHRGKGGASGEAVRLAPEDIHFKRGFTCTSCHGGDGSAPEKEKAHDPAKGYRGAPKGLAVIETCGRCHSDLARMRDFNPNIGVDQAAQYMESHHGRTLKSGDTAVATCVSCHGNHGIRQAKDPLSPVYPTNVPATCGTCHGDPAVMKGRKARPDVLEKYRGSVHGRALLERGDLAAPACNSCHGNHGATPPNAESVANVCGTCHVQQAEHFRGSPHRTVFDQNELAECVFCHSNHDIAPPTDAMRGVGPKSVCVQCHEDGRKAAVRFQAAFEGLESRIATAHEVLGRAERAGMEVSDPLFALAEAGDRLTEARVVLHTFQPSRVLSKVGEGEAVAVEARGKGEEALAEMGFRRTGLYWSLVGIALLAAGLWMKIREVDARLPREADGT